MQFRFIENHAISLVRGCEAGVFRRRLVTACCRFWLGGVGKGTPYLLLHLADVELAIEDVLDHASEPHLPAMLGKSKSKGPKKVLGFNSPNLSHRMN